MFQLPLGHGGKILSVVTHRDQALPVSAETSYLWGRNHLTDTIATIPPLQFCFWVLRFGFKNPLKLSFVFIFVETLSFMELEEGYFPPPKKKLFKGW